MYRGTSLITKRPPPQDPPRSLGIGVRWGPMGGSFLMSEVPLKTFESLQSRLKGLRGSVSRVRKKKTKRASPDC